MSLRIDPLTPSPAPFGVSLLLALSLHAVAVAAWMAVPHERVSEVPVRVLNLKLGDGDDIPMEEIAAEIAGGNAASVDSELSRQLTGDAPAPRPRPRPQAPSPLAKALGRAAIQHMRERPAFDYRTGGGSTELAGNSFTGSRKAADAAKVRYDTIMKEALQKAKVYPEDMRRQGIKGTGMVEVQINRRGEVRNAWVSKSTGSPMLDRAMLDAVNRARPFPSPPNEYEPGSFGPWQFKFTITFGE